MQNFRSGFPLMSNELDEICPFLSTGSVHEWRQRHPARRLASSFCSRARRWTPVWNTPSQWSEHFAWLSPTRASGTLEILVWSSLSERTTGSSNTPNDTSSSSVRDTRYPCIEQVNGHIVIDHILLHCPQTRAGTPAVRKERLFLNLSSASLCHSVYSYRLGG